MTIKVSKDDVFIAELEMKRLSKKLADARLVYRELNGSRHVELRLEKAPERLQKLLPQHFRKVAAMRKSGELDEAKAAREDWVAARRRDDDQRWGWTAN